MKKSVTKNKVGRPKLADSKTKKESIFICIFVLIIIGIVAILGYNILTIDFNPKYNVASVYNKNIGSCTINENKIECGPRVTNIKYKIDDNQYVEVSKETSNIEINLPSYKKINLCYKTKNTNYNCIK